jgi:hypothetical protein
MNDHIKQLARQAKIPEYHLEYGTELCIAPHLEKFAELLIRECVSICYAESRTAGANGDLAEYGALSRAGGNIKEHFGVKE